MKKFYLLIAITFLILRSYATIHVITVQNFSFSPSSLTVNCNDTIRFSWISGSHPVTSETGAWTVFTMSASLTVQDIVLTTAGSYPYYCALHGGPGGVGMSGTITVTCEPPACPTPTGLTASNITSTSAKIKWDVMSGATKYQIQYRPSGTMAWLKKNSTTNSKNISMLTPSTMYQYRVKTVCETSSSPFTSIKSFTTLAGRLANPGLTMGIYPNPNDGKFQVVLDQLEEGNVTIDVFDLDGKRIYTEQFVNASEGVIHYITIPDGFNGIALVRVTNDNRTISRLITVE